MINRPFEWLFERVGKRMNGQPCDKHNNRMNSHPVGWSVIQTLKHSIVQIIKRTSVQSVIHSTLNSTGSMTFRMNGQTADHITECMINFMYNPLND